MGIGDIFRPKHKHSDAAVREEAVRELAAEDLEALLEVAREDEDPEVRALALERIADPEALLELSESEALGTLRRRAQERADLLLAERALAAGSEAAARDAITRLAGLDSQRGLAEIVRRDDRGGVRRAALAEIQDPRTLAELARAAEDPETRAAALERIEDEDSLRAIAVDETRKEVALPALDRIETPEVLEAVGAKAKHRAVRSRAQRRLKERRPAAEEISPEKQRHAERVQLCRRVEKLARGHEWVESHHQVTEAAARWRELGDGSDRELAKRFQDARDRYFARYEKYGKETAAAVAARREAEPEPPTSAPASAPAPEPGEAAAKEPSAEAGAAAEDESSPAPPERRADPEARSKRNEEREKNLAELEKLTAQLEELAPSVDRLKTGERWLSRADKHLKELGPLPSGKKKQAVAALEEARRKLLIRVGELREAEEWKRWANVPKQKELIARVEALLTSNDEQSLASELKKAQKEWKSVGPVQRERGQELWQRFKTVCDQVYERVKEVRARSAEEQKENLRLKEELCVRAEEISESTDWGPAADKLKRLQAEWKKIGPVPRRQSDKIWKRFRAACDTFFERRRPHLDKFIAERTENLEKKQALCEELEALAEGDSGEAVNRLGEFRRRFRQIGPVPQKELAGIQTRFREACERIEQRRAEERERERAEAIAALEQASAALEESLGAETPDPESVVERALALRAAKKSISAGGGEAAAAARDAAEALCARAVEAHPAAFRGTDLDPEANRKRKEKLVARVEELAPAEEPEEQPATTPEEMAARLRAALADRALGGVLSKASESRPAHEIVREARESWGRLGPVPGPEGAALEERFERACQRAGGSR